MVRIVHRRPGGVGAALLHERHQRIARDLGQGLRAVLQTPLRLCPIPLRRLRVGHLNGEQVLAVGVLSDDRRRSHVCDQVDGQRT